jgi:hypothetical protein
MLGFIFGTACLIGLVKTLRHGHGCGPAGYRRAWGGGGCGGARFSACGTYPGAWEAGPPWSHAHGPSHGPDRWSRRRGRGFRNFFLRGLFERLDTTPGQEKVIAAAVEELREVMRKHRGEIGKTRGDIARAMRGAAFDEAMLGELFARHDAAIEAMRKAVVGALARIHDALDEQQRARLADFLERNPDFFGGTEGHGVEI